ncbi:MAG: serine/threonine protein kinase, partial [Solirubrobacteraceae bacterium]
GTQVGEYVIERLIGEGGMGAVYGARHPVIGKRVAVKVMNRVCSAEPINVERFVQEAKAVNAIGHSNIVDIFAFGRTHDERCYFVMEWLQGESLRARLDRGAPSGAHVLDILDGVLRALEAAHAAGIVHRDLKPDNIFLLAAKDDQPERVKLLDFGIAKALGDAPELTKDGTKNGTMKGKYAYMAPEQTEGDDVDNRSDIFACGIVLHEVLTGRRLFKGTNDVQTIERVRRCDVPPPSLQNPAVPPALDAIVLKALQRNPDDRWGDAADMANALDDVVHEARFQPTNLAQLLYELFPTTEGGGPPRGSLHPTIPHATLSSSSLRSPTVPPISRTASGAPLFDPGMPPSLK